MLYLMPAEAKWGIAMFYLDILLLQTLYHGYLQPSPFLPALRKSPFALAVCLSAYWDPPGLAPTVASSSCNAFSAGH